MAAKTASGTQRQTARREIVSFDFAGLADSMGAAFSRGGADARHTIEAAGVLLKEIAAQKDKTIADREATIADREATITDLLGRLGESSRVVEKCAERAVEVVFSEARVRAGEKKAELDHELSQEKLQVFKGTANKFVEMLPALVPAMMPAQQKLAPMKRVLEKVLQDEDLCGRLQALVGTEDWLALMECAGSL